VGLKTPPGPQDDYKNTGVYWWWVRVKTTRAGLRVGNNSPATGS